MATAALSEQESSEAPPALAATGRRHHDWRDPRHHDEAVVQAEARRLTRALAPYGILTERDLARLTQATKWHQGCFERALSAALRNGSIERLPAGFVRFRRSGARYGSNGRGRRKAL